MAMMYIFGMVSLFGLVGIIWAEYEKKELNQKV